MARLVPDAQQDGPQLSAIGDAIVPIDHFFLTFYNFKTTIYLPLFGNSYPFRLADVCKPTADAVTKTQTDVSAWLVDGALTKDGLRGVIQSDLLGAYVRVATTFSATADALIALTGQIAPSGATPAQIAQAQQAFAALSEDVKTAGDGIAALSARFATFQTDVIADVAALQSGPAAIDEAIARAPQVFQDFITANGGGGLLMPVVMKMAAQYADAYVKALTAVQDQLASGLSAATAAAPALVSLSGTWDTLSKVTADVAATLAEAQAAGLADALTALDLATAQNEWAALSRMAAGIAGQMDSEGLYGNHGMLTP